MFTHAIVRKPGSHFFQGISAKIPVEPNYKRILEQHAEYVKTLKALGATVVELEPASEFPDAYFVEDTAVVTDEVAVICRPGASSRAGETDLIVPELMKFRDIERIQAPGTLDGGDVLQAGTHFFIGISERTNREGADQLGRILEKWGYTWDSVPVGEGLHLKSSVNWIGSDKLIITEALMNRKEFSGWNLITVPRTEEYAANTLLFNDHLLISKGYIKTKRKLEQLGIPIIELDVGEMRKMDGGLTCLSLRFRVRE